MQGACEWQKVNIQHGVCGVQALLQFVRTLEALRVIFNTASHFATKLRQDVRQLLTRNLALINIAVNGM